MHRLQGIAVSPGICICEALVIENDKGVRIPQRFITADGVQDEIDFCQEAFHKVADEIAQNRDTITKQLGKQYGAIFSAHLQMVGDPELKKKVEHFIRDKRYSAAYAVSRAMRQFAKVFEGLDDAYLAERVQDIFDIESRLLNKLLGTKFEYLSSLNQEAVVFAHNLTPSETANLDRGHVRGFVTEVGGLGGHTSIIAEALQIPAVVAAGHFLEKVQSGDTVIVDGNSGQVYLCPDEETLAQYETLLEEEKSRASELELLSDLPAETLDGTNIELRANIEFPEELTCCLENGAQGVGLYRTEFLYLTRSTEPDEEAHYQAYAQVAEAFGNQPVTIRTLDMGADKINTSFEDLEESNPFLGVRSIRLSLRDLPPFRTQIRAILRASVKGNLQVMFPLISTLREFRQAKMIVADIMEDLEEEGIPFNRDIPIGIMVEVPSAVIMLDRFVKEVDFISIGTNDLIQYTMAVDRTNKEVADLYQPSNPAVLRLIESSIVHANAGGILSTLCGQMSGSPAYTMLLLGLGLRSFSVAPASIPEIKKTCRQVTIKQCQTIAKKVMTLEGTGEINSYLREQYRKVTEVAEET
ncbi:MAG: phosphoenolpyruvate--protein phosphotransferase [Pirellulaceae bacterium]|nr:phosphoenolpyruvate--protein phosphotransferase [Pirellulaceae bacterium]